MSPHYQSMLRLIQKGRFFHCGSGKLYKSYAYAANIAHQYAKLMQAETNKINRKTFYLADYEPLSLRDYINGLAEAMQAPRVPTVPNFLAKAMAITGDILNTVGLSRFPFNSFRLRNILTEYQFDLSETKAVCGELPYTFSDGVKETASWWLQQTG